MQQLTQRQKKHIESLHIRKYRDEWCEFIVEGHKGVEEAVNENARMVLIVIEEGKISDEDSTIDLAKTKNIPIVTTSKKDMGDITDTKTPPGILSIVKYQEQRLEHIDPSKPLIILDRIGDPGNVGTIIRTADWFGFDQILLTEGCVDVYNPKVVRSTMGSIFRLRLIQSTDDVQNYIEFLKQKRYSIVSLTMDGQPIDQLKHHHSNVAYVFGSESHGVSQDILDVSDFCCTIPKIGHAESLNVGVAVGITLSHIRY